MLKVKNPKKAPNAYTAAQQTDVKAWVVALPDTIGFATFAEIRAAVPIAATLSDGALQSLLIDSGYELG